MLKETWTSGSWANNYFNTWTYDSAGNKLTYLVQHWISGNWVNYYNETCTYNSNGNMLTDFSEIWSSGAWINSSLSTYLPSYIVL